MCRDDFVSLSRKLAAAGLVTKAEIKGEGFDFELTLHGQIQLRQLAYHLATLPSIDAPALREVVLRLAPELRATNPSLGEIEAFVGLVLNHNNPRKPDELP
jgi:hypothetical protein